MVYRAKMYPRMEEMDILAAAVIAHFTISQTRRIIVPNHVMAGQPEVMGEAILLLKKMVLKGLEGMVPEKT